MSGPNLYETSLLAQRDATQLRIAGYRKQIDALADKQCARAIALRKLILVNADMLDLLLKHLTIIDRERRERALTPAPISGHVLARHTGRRRVLRKYTNDLVSA